MRGWYALLMAANNRDKGNYRARLIKRMLERGADPCVNNDEDKCNALFKAASTGHADAMYVLLAANIYDPKALFKGETKDNKKHKYDTTRSKFKYPNNPNVTYLCTVHLYLVHYTFSYPGWKPHRLKACNHCSEKKS